MIRPLEGLLVIAVEQAVAAPFCTARLADAGARVIKIERKEGDFARFYDDSAPGGSSYFVWLNRGKESVVLDLAHEDGRSQLAALIARADILVQNLKPGAMTRMGLAIEDFRKIHRGLICCSISGYGDHGPLANRKAYDLLVQAESGLASITGGPNEPARVGVSIVDIATGATAHAAILEALIARGRSGEGADIRVSLFDVMAEWLTVPLLNTEAGKPPQRLGLAHPSIAPYGVFAAADGRQVLISIQSEREWKVFCADVLNAPDLAADPRFCTNVIRVRHARRPRIHTFVSTSPIHLAHQMNKTEHQVLEIIARTVTQARNLVPDVEWSAMDATRTPIDYLCRCIEAAIRAGATTINLPDTVGFATPAEYEAMFRAVLDRVPDADKAVFSTHCHDDLGLAVANSLAGVAGGARQIECTINGLGERAGNAALEEIVMALRTRGDALPYKTTVDNTMLTRASKLVSAVTSFPVQYNKAIVGRNAFAHESGIHQDGVLKNALTYEIMTPASVGLAKSSLVMGKHSGRAAFKDKLRELGYSLGDNAMQDAFVRFKALADRKKFVYDEDIEALVDDEIGRAHERIKVVSLEVHAGSRGPQTADLTLSLDGAERSFKATGNGPIDAIFNAIVTMVPHDGVLELYQVHAVTQGTDAQAEVTVRLAEGREAGHRPRRRSRHAGRFRARLLRGADKLMVKRGKLRPDTLAG